MKEAWGKVVNGQIVLPGQEKLPEGVQVHVFWGERPGELLPLEREEWTKADLEEELSGVLLRPLRK